MAKTVKKEKVEKKTAKTVKKIAVKVGKPLKKEVKKAAAPVSVTPSIGGDKQQVIKLFGTGDNDTGSPEVQVAILTWKIVKLQQHLAENPKDNHSRRGLLKIISKRRRILNYLKKKDEKRFATLEKKMQEYQKA